MAILLAARENRQKGVGALLERLKIWDVGWRWWVVAALVQPIVLLLVALAYNTLGGSSELPFYKHLNVVELPVQVVLLTIATLGEEIGWRGFALPTLLKKHSPLRASLLIGFIWSVWHIPFWLLQDSYDQYGLGYMALNFLMIVPMSIYITWFFRHTRESILLASVFHLTFNIMNVAVVPVTSLIVPYILFIIIQWLIVGWVVWSDRPIFGPVLNYGPEGSQISGDIR